MTGVFALAALVAGCEKQEQVSIYTVPTHESLQSTKFQQETAKRRPAPARMLAAIVPRGPILWFFKLQGPPDAVAAREPQFRELLKSVQFNAAGEIKWTLPDKWQERGPSEMREATLILPGEPPLEVSVIKLPAGNNLQEAVLNNINRWRNQLDLPFLEAEDVPVRTEKIEAGDNTITYLNITGKARPAPMGGMPPMAGQNMPPRGNPPQEDAADELQIQYEKPPEWTQVAPRQFTIAAFEVNEGDRKLSITLSRTGGSIVANVNRWCGQLEIDPLTEDQIAGLLKPFKLGHQIGALVEMKGPTQSLLVVMFRAGDQTVFVKLMGDPELAVRERPRFESFAASVRF